MMIVISLFSFIETFRDVDKMLGKEGYQHMQVQSVVLLIEKMDTKNIKKEKGAFLEYNSLKSIY